MKSDENKLKKKTFVFRTIDALSYVIGCLFWNLIVVVVKKTLLIVVLQFISGKIKWYSTFQKKNRGTR